MVKSKKEPQGGRVHAYILRDSTVVSADVMKQYELPSSKQLAPEAGIWAQTKTIEPPYDLVKLMDWMENCTVHARCVKQKVIDVVQIGWHLESLTDKPDEAEKEKMLNFINHANKEESLIDVLVKFMTDYEGCGLGYLEIGRDTDDLIKSLYHVSASTIRARRDEKGWLQKRGQRNRYFKKFGSEDIMNMDTGNIVKVLVIEKQANELISLLQYTHKSEYYGLPEWLPSMEVMLGDLKKKDYNVDFFTNRAVPDYAILVEGGELTEEAEKTLIQYFETEVKGKHHKTLYLPTEGGAKITLKPLAVEIKDSSFRMYGKDNREEILVAHGVPPYRIGLAIQGSLGGSVEAGTSETYKSSIIHPRQEKVEYIINEQIFKKGMLIENWMFRFNEIDLTDEDKDSQIATRYINSGIWTPNEVRRKQGLVPYRGGDIFYVAGNLMPIAEAVHGKSIDLFKGLSRRTKLERGFEKATVPVLKEWYKSLEKFTEEGDILSKIYADVQKKYPELFEEEEEKYILRAKYTGADEEFVNRLIEGWTRYVKTEDMELHLAKWKKRAANLGGQLSLEEIGMKISFELKNPALIKQIEKAGVKITGEMVKHTLDPYRNLLIKSFYEEGKHPSVIARESRDMFERSYKNRAEAIARTETKNSMSDMSIQTMERNGVEEKEWMNGPNPCELCEPLGGETVKVGESFSNGWNSPSDAHPNCECTVAPVIKAGFVPTGWTGD